MEERDYQYWLAQAAGVHAGELRRLLSLYGTAQALYESRNWPAADRIKESAESGRREINALLAERDGLEKEGIRWCFLEDPAYPKRLRELPDAPPGLYYKGRLPPEDRPSVGIVGARSCSAYGRSRAEYFGGELAAQGLSVISGMARGIDGYAQAAAVQSGGSFAVLGCGVDICYPAAHQALYDQLCESGGVISELRPGTPPLAYHFPLRNRIISGLSDILLVIEAREKSGSFITVDYALEQGRDVMALPGRVGDELSSGCNRLIRQGAGILIDCADVFEALHLEFRQLEKAGLKTEELTPEQSAVWKLMGAMPKHLDRLLEESGLSLGELSLRLLELEGMGRIRQISSGQYARR
ncbi:MAG: DNA-processing protein DprA [Lachnospiraceae bacterium]|nr:DNA-processing protein DprA [Lachnospiraceae bacterium]